MGQILPGSARTTAAIRRSIQRSQESLQALAKRHNINPKTVAKWRKRATATDAPMGPKPASTVLTGEQEAIAVAFRQHKLLPLADCLYALQEMRLSIWAHPTPFSLGSAPLFSAPWRESIALERGRAVCPKEKI